MLRRSEIINSFSAENAQSIAEGIQNRLSQKGGAARYCAAASLFVSDKPAEAQPAAQQEEEQRLRQYR